MKLRFLCAILGVCALLPACITPSVIESSGRALAPPTTNFEWREPRPADFEGLFESESIEGEVAAALWKVWYVFSSGGAYSGAALVLGGTTPEFQTLSGTWSLDGDQLDLGDGQVVRASATDDHLRLASEGGVAILRRSTIQ